MELSRTPPKDVFVSYGHEDFEAAGAFAKLLRARGFTCWFDEDNLRHGAEFRDEIIQGIRQCKLFVCLLSQTALKKNFVRFEAGAARGSGRRIIQVKLAPGSKQEFAKNLSTPFAPSEQLCDLSGGVVEGAEFDRLATDMRAWIVEAESKQKLKQLLLVVVGFLMLVGVWTVVTSVRPLASALLHGSPPVGAFLGVTTAHAEEINFAYQFPVSVKAESSAHPQIALDVYGLRAGATNWTALDDGDVLRTGEHFYVRADAFTPGFLYVFLVDSSGKLQWIFPSNPTSELSSGTNFVALGQSVSLPPQADLAYRLDDVVGEEHLFAIYSATRWEDLERVITRAATSRNGGKEIQALLAGADKIVARAKGIAAIEKVSTAREVRRQAQPGAESLPLALSGRSLRASGNWLLEVRSFRHLPAGVDSH